MTSISAFQPVERRQNTELREVFEGAYELVEPFLDPANSWGGRTLEYLAFRLMRENYPQVGSDQIYVFLSAAKRVFADRRRKP